MMQGRKSKYSKCSHAVCTHTATVEMTYYVNTGDEMKLCDWFTKQRHQDVWPLYVQIKGFLGVSHLCQTTEQL